MASNKYTIYTIGLGALLLVGGISTLASSSTISPANKTLQRTDGEEQKEAISNSPGVNRRMHSSTKGDHREAVRSLSPKNKEVFHTLSKDDKEKVVQAHKNGRSAHNKLTDVLNKDDKDHSKKKKWSAPKTGNVDSPANKAMDKQRKQNVYD